jgi:hypothetical protein
MTRYAAAGVDAGAQFEKGELVERPDEMTTTEEAA